ncbi:hypothetical protein MIR68_006192 [Amoeboaphelidium protococcarum]|nr:hypothetical protein MIR68_006192 [Amoeboaphelidium protococcarum]KAI3645888.1 hypothetical protein MP228_008816 [Amoeboaphelidium protococcarum]
MFTSLVIAVGACIALSAVSATGGCIDLSQSVCGQYGINVKLPTTVYPNISTFNAVFGQPDDNGPATRVQNGDLCPNIDLSDFNDQALQYQCLTFTPTTFDNINQTEARAQCNGGNAEYPQELIMCKSSCESYAKATVEYATKRGCSEISKKLNSTSIAAACQALPTTGCNAITFTSSALNQAQVGIVSILMIAFGSYLVI